MKQIKYYDNSKINNKISIVRSRKFEQSNRENKENC